MQFLFYVNSPHGDALKDLEWCETHPLGGSETAVLRLAAALQKRGHAIELVTDSARLAGHRADVFISCRDWRALAVDPLPGKLNYLWCQDDVDQTIVKDLANPDLARQLYARCTAVVMLSTYQWQRWHTTLNLPVDKVFRCHNAVALDRYRIDVANLAKRPPRAYFSSVPWRGLQQLVDLWPLVKGAVPEAELVVASSLKVYGQPDEDAKMAALYEKARALPGIDYRGSIAQRELREVAISCRALAYPCVFPETSCIAAMEAMAAGAVVVSTTLGALPETAWRNPLIPLSENWGMAWAFELARVLVDDDYYVDLARQNLALSQYNSWDHVATRLLQRIRCDQGALTPVTS